MSAGSLWHQLTTKEALEAGWHLARADSRNDFLNYSFYTDAFTTSFVLNIEEIAHRIRSGTYRPSPLIQIDVPKATLAIRPGSLPSLEDRIVLQAIVKLLAPAVEAKLLDSVYSYRLKKNPRKDELFEESDVTDIPYLKSRTIWKFIDPFDAWYARWPVFDKISRVTFLDEGYKFLAISDISAYFENIQLPILRDTLMGIFPTEQRIINLAMQFLEDWAVKTSDGRAALRGIPQGTQISSFFGNLFLIPLDEAFRDFASDNDVRYFRYMDDVRVFAKDYTVARKAILEMDGVIRRTHLNTQSAKTVILSEANDEEITRHLIDARLDRLNKYIDELRETPQLDRAGRLSYLEKIRAIAHVSPREPEQPIFRSKRPLKGLSLRTFRRWITIHSMLNSAEFLPRLFREIRCNPDFRLTRKVVHAARQFGARKDIARQIHDFVQSPYNIFKHQEAELLWAARYLRWVPDELVNRAKEALCDTKNYFYVRMQAAYLLSRFPLDEKFLNTCRDLLRQESNPHVQTAIAGLLTQFRGKKHRNQLHAIVFHPNEAVRKIGRLFREVECNEDIAIGKLRFGLQHEVPWRVFDCMPYLYCAAESDRPRILRYLVRGIDEQSPAYRGSQIVGCLELLRARAQSNLDRLTPRTRPNGRSKVGDTTPTLEPAQSEQSSSERKMRSLSAKLCNPRSLASENKKQRRGSISASGTQGDLLEALERITGDEHSS